MKHFINILIFCLTLAAIGACKKENSQPPAPQVQQQPMPPRPISGKVGKVVEAASADGYSYLLVDTGTEKIWAAAPEFPVTLGSNVVVPEGTEMTEYHSSALNRTFDKIVFVDTIGTGEAAQPPAAAQPAATPQQPTAQ